MKETLFGKITLQIGGGDFFSPLTAIHHSLRAQHLQPRGLKCWAFVFALALAAVGCTTDDPLSNPEDPATTTRTPSPTGDDPEGQPSGGITIMVDTTWAGTYDYDFDGRPIGNPDSVAIALPEGSAEEGDAQDAV